jgi:hypothetical protein
MNSADCRRWRLLPPLWGKVGMGGRAMPTRLASLVREALRRNATRAERRVWRAIAFRLRLKANPISMARPPILAFPRKGGRDATRIRPAEDGSTHSPYFDPRGKRRGPRRANAVSYGTGARCLRDSIGVPLPSRAALRVAP